MTARPEGLIDVKPRVIALYTALCWIGDEEDPALLWLAHNHGWRIMGMVDSIRKGRCLMILGKNKRRYLVSHGDYVVALGGNGSLKVCTRKEFDRDYREVK